MQRFPSALPSRSSASLVIVAVYRVFDKRLAFGTKVAVVTLLIES